ncbi:MAG: hypothetical protein LAO07_02840 [Acidobacteriia bacterium]|nr:hypothetical protein [Terriglobia bacterium]
MSGLRLSCSVSIAFFALATVSAAFQEPHFTAEQQREFLLNAKVVGSKPIGLGKTHPWRLTLSDGTVTHDAAFNIVDELKNVMKFSGGRTELNFRDSYEYDIAAYELARLIGLDDMIPVTVERRWEGKRGALSWWLPVKMDENKRTKENLQPPNQEAWNRQMHKVRVFTQLIYDTDRNRGNLLITEDWKIYMIDFTRAFRLNDKLETPSDLERCDRQLLEKLRQLDGQELLNRTKPHLTKSEVKSLMARRDKIVKIFDQLIAQKGEDAVLY